MPLFAPSPAIRNGFLPDLDGHRVFWECFGDPQRPAILLLHGGPGGGTAPRMPRLFDPARWHIITMDQRGAGRSTPHAGDSLDALADNQTRDLIHDIDRLRQHLNLSRLHLYGSSWGATLAQAYAHAHPARVASMILAAVTTTSRFEIDWLFGDARHFLPEPYEAFARAAPPGITGTQIAALYSGRLASPDPAIADQASRDWCAWEAAVLTVDPRAEMPQSFENARFRLGFARLVTHYFKNLAWLDPPLLARARDLAAIPAVLINSRQDLSTPLSTAWALHNAWPKSRLVVIPGALHGTLYGPLSEAVITAGTDLSHSA